MEAAEQTIVQSVAQRGKGSRRWVGPGHATRTRTQRSAGAYNSTMYYTVHHHAPLQQTTALRTRESTEERSTCELVRGAAGVIFWIKWPNNGWEQQPTAQIRLWKTETLKIKHSITIWDPPPPPLLYCVRYIKVNVNGGACRMSVTRCYYLRLTIPEKESYSN